MKILINAVSAKHGGARTIVESFVSVLNNYKNIDFVVFAGFDCPLLLPDNVTWVSVARSGISAVVYSLFSVFFDFKKYRCDFLISFGNINSVLIHSSKKITYFHQLKALDPKLFEPKLFIIRGYLRYSSESIIVQSAHVQESYFKFFSLSNSQVYVVWPGISIPSMLSPRRPISRLILVPVASPESVHKNFKFVEAVAKLFGDDWCFFVTAPVPSDVKSIPKNIHYAGVQSQSELFDLYRTAQCTLMSSTHETVGLPIFESLAVGTPVVAYDAEYINSFSAHFGISSGLSIVDAPEKAKLEIINYCESEVGITSAVDFKVGEWNKIFDLLKLD